MSYFDVNFTAVCHLERGQTEYSTALLSNQWLQLKDTERNHITTAADLSTQNTVGTDAENTLNWGMTVCVTLSDNAEIRETDNA